MCQRGATSSCWCPGRASCTGRSCVQPHISRPATDREDELLWCLLLQQLNCLASTVRSPTVPLSIRVTGNASHDWQHLLQAKFHYTSWFGARSEPASVMEFGREPASSCYFAASKLDDRPNFSFEPASNQLRTCSEPAPNYIASVMEFGFSSAKPRRSICRRLSSATRRRTAQCSPVLRQQRTSLVTRRTSVYNAAVE